LANTGIQAKNAPPANMPGGGPLWVPIALILTAMVSMQLGAAFAKGLFPAVGAQGTTALRLTFSAMMLAAAYRPWRNLRWDRSLLPLLAYGLSLGTMNTLFYMALRTVPLGIAIALEFLGPLAVAVAGSRRWSDGAWTALALAGLGLLLPLRQTVYAVDPVGATLALGSGAAWALYIVFGRRVGAAYGARGVALGMIIAAVVFAPLGVAAVGPARFTLALLPSGALLALLSSAIPYSLEMAALTRIPARVFGTLMSLEPAVGALAGLAILHETLAPLQWAGLAAVMLASLGTVLTLRVDAQPVPA
jgi:inner membrane transporter RhtA